MLVIRSLRIAVLLAPFVAAAAVFAVVWPGPVVDAGPGLRTQPFSVVGVAQVLWFVR